MEETTRPPGKTTIAPNVLLTITRLATLGVEGVSNMSTQQGGVNRIFLRGYDEGVRIRIEEDRVYADLYVILEAALNVREVSSNIESEVSRAITEMVGMEVGRVNVHIDDIAYPNDISAEAGFGMKPRTKARSIALQVLFEIDLVDHPLGRTLTYRLEDTSLDERLSEFVREIVQGVWPMCQQLDKFIADHAPDWPLNQVATIDRNILRIALWEFAVNGETPMKVAINEAVELAKTFGSDSSPRFVNGVLGSLAARENEIRQALEKLGSSKK